MVLSSTLTVGSTIGAADTIVNKWVPLEMLRSRQTLEALAYWQQKRGTQRTPSLADFDPAEIPRLLPYLTVADVSQGAPRKFTFRIMGEAQKDASGLNAAGKTTDMFASFGSDLQPYIEALYNEICESREPCATTGNLGWIKRAYREFEAVILPFSRDGDEVARIISVAAYKDIVYTGGR